MTDDDQVLLLCLLVVHGVDNWKIVIKSAAKCRGNCGKFHSAAEWSPILYATFEFNFIIIIYHLMHIS